MGIPLFKMGDKLATYSFIDKQYHDDVIKKKESSN